MNSMPRRSISVPAAISPASRRFAADRSDPWSDPVIGSRVRRDDDELGGQPEEEPDEDPPHRDLPRPQALAREQELRDDVDDGPRRQREEGDEHELAGEDPPDDRPGERGAT